MCVDAGGCKLKSFQVPMQINVTQKVKKKQARKKFKWM